MNPRDAIAGAAAAAAALGIFKPSERCHLSDEEAPTSGPFVGRKTPKQRTRWKARNRMARESRKVNRK